MVFHRRSEPQEPRTATAVAVPREQKPVIQHMAAMTGHNSIGEESLIGSDLSIEGQTITIRCKGMLRVNGNIQADVHSRQLEVGREAIITGTITAESVEINGRVNGAILSNKVVLHSTAEVEGDIAAQFLAIDQGASFDGRSRKVRDPNEIVPQTETGQAAPTRGGDPYLQPPQPGAATYLNGTRGSETPLS
jgi:cytoskeletal protein CcmA (bactofilin family)